MANEIEVLMNGQWVKAAEYGEVQVGDLYRSTAVPSHVTLVTAVEADGAGGYSIKGDPAGRSGIYQAKFVPGDTVVWSPENFNSDYWDNLSEEDRIKYYGVLGYGAKRKKLFTFLCYHRPQDGHCVLVSMDDQRVETMRHPDEFVLVHEDDC